ncbi:hypothetical protein XM38_009680 [Halomicronema hongdechloris C2206]|uniref:Type I restriction enzyme R protein N-terminal domain-containing protein n=1 Tax=Halomicronema hongdechloris C2206 TaxID=1641165 RepID=A0A1Z3HIC4_9CYAN|nr:hypothetical protein [Halomicronema hongdechloris]ASC70038.1 hypothetical protein XM38_009680 [Halomicronema hongdechloris C2206]
MPRPPIIQADQSYTFADYFRLNFAPGDILGYFDATLQKQFLSLPQHQASLDRLPDLRRRIEESLPRLSLTSEMARREFLIAPVLMEVLHYTEATLNVEYPVAVSNLLKGSLDYFLRSHQNLLVIEAKNEDLERGFVQLAVEFIALDQWLETEESMLLGAVSTGTIWQFGQFHRASRQVTQDLTLYRVPTDLEDLMRILVGILRGEG